MFYIWNKEKGGLFLNKQLNGEVSDIKVIGSLELEEVVSRMNSLNSGNIQSKGFYLGLADGIVSKIGIDLTSEIDRDNLPILNTLFSMYFTRLGNNINESILSVFDVKMFREYCNSLVILKYGSIINNSKKEYNINLDKDVIYSITGVNMLFNTNDLIAITNSSYDMFIKGKYLSNSII